MTEFDKQNSMHSARVLAYRDQRDVLDHETPALMPDQRQPGPTRMPGGNALPGEAGPVPEALAGPPPTGDAAAIMTRAMLSNYGPVPMMARSAIKALQEQGLAIVPAAMPERHWERIAFNLCCRFGQEFTEPLGAFARAVWVEAVAAARVDGGGS